MKKPWNNGLISEAHAHQIAEVNSEYSLFVELRRDLATTRNVVIGGFLTGIAVIIAWHSEEPKMHVLIFWALACYASSALMGFLFGIPRVLQKPTGLGTSPSETGAGTNAPRSYELIINTNLDDVSDWLTKIIVGVGLVEIRKVPNMIYRLSKLIAGGNSDAVVPLVIAIIIYFSVLGFMSGYLTTRMFFERAFRIADLAAVGSIRHEIAKNEIAETATETADLRQV